MLVAVLCAALLLAAPAVAAPVAFDLAAATQTFTQRVDHFDAKNTATYEQRYVFTDQFAAPSNASGTPTFIFLAGEAPMEFFEFQEVSAVHWAKQFGARYVSLEHRYYGKSLPTPTYATASLQKLLNVEQAMADAAAFIEAQKKADPTLGPWIVFGCSYSGALSAWFRGEYPHLVAGSVAPSGPEVAQSDFSGFFNHFGKIAPKSCVDVAHEGSMMIEALFAVGENEYLETLFNTCGPLTKKEDQFLFKFNTMGTLGSSDQFENPHANWPLNHTCDMMTGPASPLVGWANALNASLGGGPGCNDYSEANFLAGLQDEKSQDRSWWWQKCNEFGFFKPSYGASAVWFDDVTLAPIVGWCEKIFGVKGLAPNTAAINKKYGGTKPKGTNIISTNGIFDPWHLLSILPGDADPARNVQSYLYEAGHCAPMTAPQANDPKDLQLTRQKVHDFLADVLKKATKQ